MKKQLFLSIAALLVCALSVPAFAAEPQGAEIVSAEGLAYPLPPAATLYPSEITEYTEGDTPRLDKLYILSADDDPAGIPTADFDREGCTYTLLDLTRTDQTETDAKQHTEVITLNTDSADLDKILPQLPATQELTTEGGYTGVLTLDTASVKVEAAGYASKSYGVSAKRTYPSLSDADVSLIPKTTTENGRTLTLSDVQWTESENFYTATATYSGTASSKYATGYVVTAEYSGEVTKTTSDAVLYTATFSGTPTADGKRSAVSWPIVAGGAAGALLLGAGAAYAVKRKKKGAYHA